AGLAWHWMAGEGTAGRAYEIAATLAGNVLPPVNTPATGQQAALARFAAGLNADVALFSADRVLLAAVGESLPPPSDSRIATGWMRRWNDGPAWTVRLPDGRWLVARMKHAHGLPGYRVFALLGLLALAVGVGAYPVARRMTRRIERLQS